VTICALFTNSWGQIDKYITDMIVKLWFSGKWNATEGQKLTLGWGGGISDLFLICVCGCVYNTIGLSSIFGKKKKNALLSLPMLWSSSQWPTLQRPLSVPSKECNCPWQWAGPPGLTETALPHTHCLAL